MSQNIECTECHDLVTLEGGRVINIPFCCNSCTNEAKAETFAGAYPPSAEGEPVEDTNAIIADLQQQLSQLAEYVADIEVQLQNSRNESLMNELRANSLASDNEFINQQNTEVNKQLSQVRRDLKAALGIAERLS